MTGLQKKFSFLRESAQGENVAKLSVLTGRANIPLAQSVASALSIDLGRRTLENFPDDELHIEIHEDLRDHDVYILQPTGPPVGGHLLELLLLADACIRAGASRLTGVIPYLGYARQDRRALGREPMGARLVAELLCTRLHRIITLDLHNAAIEGFFSIPMEHLSAVPLLADSVRKLIPSDNMVVVAPDQGAVKHAQRYAGLLDLPLAYVHKVRLSGAEVTVQSIVGDVRGKYPIVIDDMVSTGGTIVSAIEALIARGCQPTIAVAASHALLVGSAPDRLAALPIKDLFFTDSLLQPATSPLPLRVVSLGRLLADTIKRLHGDFA